MLACVRAVHEVAACVREGGCAGAHAKVCLHVHMRAQVRVHVRMHARPYIPVLVRVLRYLHILLIALKACTHEVQGAAFLTFTP